MHPPIHTIQAAAVLPTAVLTAVTADIVGTVLLTSAYLQANTEAAKAALPVPMRLLMPTSQAMAAQAMLARGLAAAAIARAVLPVMPQAMPALIRASRHLTEAVAAAMVQDMQLVQQDLAPTCSIGAATAAVLAIQAIQVPLAPAAQADTAATVQPAYLKHLLAAAVQAQAIDQAVTTKVQDMLPAIRVHVRTHGVLTAAVHAIADTAVQTVEQ